MAGWNPHIFTNFNMLVINVCKTCVQWALTIHVGAMHLDVALSNFLKLLVTCCMAHCKLGLVGPHSRVVPVNPCLQQCRGICIRTNPESCSWAPILPTFHVGSRCNVLADPRMSSPRRARVNKTFRP